MNPGKRRHVPRITLTPSEAWDALGIGEATFNEFVRPFVRAIHTGRTGTLTLYRVAELDRWADENSERTL